MPLLRRKEARENSFQLLVIKGIGILFLRPCGWLDPFQLRLIENR
ncbi:MAG TPA: hypothetical protein VEM15_07260 [Thermodesulfobacteriota bacterium]|nr:hypothetical protein [Thermodesulfobacteriota bacterium]